MDNVTKFLVYCIEIYKYLTDCYDALHTTGPEYIIEDIAGLIKERQ